MTKQLKEAIAVLESLKSQKQDAEKVLAAVKCKFGQDMVNVSVGGHTFAFQTLSRESGWMPYVIKGCEELQQAAEKIMKHKVLALEGKIEGATWKIQQIAKEMK
jgi:uncharacterized lipoprotein YehR (DUF1307 family)